MHKFQTTVVLKKQQNLKIGPVTMTKVVLQHLWEPFLNSVGLKCLEKTCVKICCMSKDSYRNFLVIMHNLQ